MKKIVTAIALVATLISAPAFAKAKHTNEQATQAAGAEYTTNNSSNFQNQWNDGNW